MYSWTLDVVKLKDTGELRSLIRLEFNHDNERPWYAMAASLRGGKALETTDPKPEWVCPPGLHCQWHEWTMITIQEADLREAAKSKAGLEAKVLFIGAGAEGKVITIPAALIQELLAKTGV